MPKFSSVQMTVNRRLLQRAAATVVALFGLALIPGAVGKTFWVAFLVGVLVLIALSVAALIGSRRARAR